MWMESKTKLIEGFVALKGRKRLRRTLKISVHGEEFAESVLLSLIQENKDTEFGRAHHFDRIHTVQEQTYALYRDMMIYRGTSPNQIKPVRVIDNPIKEKFFQGLVRYMEAHDAD